MRNSAISAGTIVLLTLSSASAWADTLTIPNSFVAGTKAVAADVNENFEATKDAVNDNAAEIASNATAIGANTAALATKATANDVISNTTAIGANANAISLKADASDVIANTNAISTKADSNDVTANATAIGSNTTSISNNTSAIATKAAIIDVEANTTAITSNATLINANTNTIGENTNAINANTADIATKGNSSDVDTNTTDIATNAAKILANETEIADLKQGNTCVGNNENDIMIKVGPLCVDKYEASVWNSAMNTQYGANSDNYPDSNPSSTYIGCDDNGHGCAKSTADAIYAESRPGVMPSRYITWFQAAQACANSGKRLLTNAEWQVAAAGTDRNNCNVIGTGEANTDANPSCTSNWGITNMVGNVNEWVADWIQGANDPVTGDQGANYDNDSMYGIRETVTGSHSLAAIVRGGGQAGGGVFVLNAALAPSHSGDNIGFRCAR